MAHKSHYEILTKSSVGSIHIPICILSNILMAEVAVRSSKSRVMPLKISTIGGLSKGPIRKYFSRLITVNPHIWEANFLEPGLEKGWG